MRARRLAARWLIPVEGAPIERAALLIASDGRVEALGSDSSVPRPPNVVAEDFGEAVILPGLINTHTHLELTGFNNQVQERNFAAWIRRLRELKTTRTRGEYLNAARDGLQSCYAAGVTTIADTGDSGVVAEVLAERDGSGIVYQEVFGPDPSQVRESITDLQQKVNVLRRFESARVRIGVSPHAPYTVSGPLFQAVADWALSEQIPIAVHIAESSAETEFLAAATGDFAEAWHRRGIPDPEPLGTTPVAWLAQHDVLSERTLCIHAVRVNRADIELLHSSGSAVAHCPLSNRAHGHGDAPLSAMLEAGLRVGLGTDSEVSVGTLDMLGEARAAAALASLSAEEAIDLCTLGGARALGLESEIGSLSVGKWGDCAVIGLSDQLEKGSPVERVLSSSPADVVMTCIGGKDVYHKR
jgi:cytosine/adenosine deaminase-related metal-dependent hydrolase